MVNLKPGETLSGKSYTVACSFAHGAGDISNIAKTLTSNAGKMEVLISCIGGLASAAPAEMLKVSLMRLINHFINESRTSLLKILKFVPRATKDIRSIYSHYARPSLYKTRPECSKIDHWTADFGWFFFLFRVFVSFNATSCVWSRSLILAPFLYKFLFSFIPIVIQRVMLNTICALCRL